MILRIALLSFLALYVAAFQELASQRGELFFFDGIEAVYQLPTVKPYKGVVFLAHGCAHSATDWWPRSTSCPDCLGLPVERKIVKYGISKGYIMFAVSSKDRVTKCWSVEDITRAVAIIKEFYTKRLGGNTKIPLFLFGASSGGNFIAHLAQNRYIYPPVSSLAVQISPIHTTRAHHIAPVLFMIMKKDAQIYAAIERIRREIDVSDVLVANELQITPSYFYDQSDGYISVEESIGIQGALVKGGFLDSAHKLTTDPRSSQWRTVVMDLISESKDSLRSDQSTISELLNLSWAYHEIIGQFTMQLFQWYEVHNLPHVV